MADNVIRIQGAQQNNLKNLDLTLPLGELIVVTGVSGSGKSSLAFDTIYAEGQRRYVETFSPYARQFLDRMDRPKVERIDGIPPSIAIDQTNPVRTSRSTVGTMTELNDHLKLLFARAAALFCHGCGRPVERDTPDGIYTQLMQAIGQASPRLIVTFAIEVPHNFSNDEIKQILAQQGYTRIHREQDSRIEVVQDRVRLDGENRGRLTEALEIALEKGHGQCAVYPLDENRETGEPWRFSSGLHCAHCDIHYREPQPNLFSFNSALGACDSCRGFGRTIGIDWNLVIPDDSLSLSDGAIKPFRSGYSMECQEDLMRYGRKRSMDLVTPWRDLDEATRRWVIEGDGSWDGKTWYGVQEYAHPRHALQVPQLRHLSRLPRRQAEERGPRLPPRQPAGRGRRAGPVAALPPPGHRHAGCRVSGTAGPQYPRCDAAAVGTGASLFRKTLRRQAASP